MIAECQHRVMTLARVRPNTAVYDLSMLSPMTSDETRWWDAVHLRPEAIAQLSHELATAISGTDGPDAHTLIVTPIDASVSATDLCRPSTRHL